MESNRLHTAMLLPVSAIVPTRNRSPYLGKMLGSLAEQSAQPVEVVILDASTSADTERLCQTVFPGLGSEIIYRRAVEVGAAAQRNQAIDYASQETLLFIDDDIVFETDCLKRLWEALQSDSQLGGVNAMIVNQRYLPPGLVSRSLFRLLNGKAEPSYAGKCIGPALNLLPEDRPDLPGVVPVEWLNTTCTLYRRAALPQPPFSSHFTGYSLMEDVALSLIVGKKWKLANARTARIFHNSQSGGHKSYAANFSEMELLNRHYVMTRIMGRTRIVDYMKLSLLQLFGVATQSITAKGFLALPQVLLGRARAIGKILSSGNE